MDKKKSYETAIKELEEIISRMEQGQFDLDSLVAEMKKAESLIKICRARIKKTDAELNKFLSPE